MRGGGGLKFARTGAGGHSGLLSAEPHRGTREGRGSGAGKGLEFRGG